MLYRIFIVQKIFIVFHDTHFLFNISLQFIMFEKALKKSIRISHIFPHANHLHKLLHRSIFEREKIIEQIKLILKI